MTDYQRKSYIDIGKIFSLISCTVAICFYLGDIKVSIQEIKDGLKESSHRIDKIENVIFNQRVNFKNK